MPTPSTFSGPLQTFNLAAMVAHMASPSHGSAAWKRLYFPMTPSGSTNSLASPGPVVTPPPLVETAPPLSEAFEQVGLDTAAAHSTAILFCPEFLELISFF